MSSTAKGDSTRCVAVKEESEHIDIVIVVSVAVVMNVVSIVYMSHCIAAYGLGRATRLGRVAPAFRPMA